MSYLIDTNVISELRRKIPDPAVVNWFFGRSPETLHLSVLTLGEIRKGLEAMPETAKKLALLDWLETGLPLFFSGRILKVDEAVADRWGRLVGRAQRPLPAIDSLLAATALEHDLILVTRNVKDFSGLVETVDPWTID